MRACSSRRCRSRSPSLLTSKPGSSYSRPPWNPREGEARWETRRRGPSRHRRVGWESAVGRGRLLRSSCRSAMTPPSEAARSRSPAASPNTGDTQCSVSATVVYSRAAQIRLPLDTMHNIRQTNNFRPKIGSRDKYATLCSEHVQ